MTELSIIIVNWKSAHYLDKCIKTIMENTKDLSFEIIVVDNASFGGSSDVAGKYGSVVKFIQSDENLGFARANNLGSQHTKGNVLLFLNPDTEIVGNALAIMLNALEKLPKAAGIGCRILNSDLTLQVSCVQSFPTILNQMLDSSWLRRLSPNSSLWGTSPLYEGRGVPEEVEVISGACLMVKKPIFETVGRFREDYFMYAEDLDLCYKMFQRG